MVVFPALLLVAHHAEPFAEGFMRIIGNLGIDGNRYIGHIANPFAAPDGIVIEDTFLPVTTLYGSLGQVIDR